MTETTYDSVEKIWSGPKDKEYYGPDMTLGEVALLILKLHSDKVMQVFDPTGETLTGGQLYEQSRRLAHAFQLLKLHRGDVVGISATNTTYLTEVVIAALLNGTPIHPLHPQFEQGEKVSLRERERSLSNKLYFFYRDCGLHVRDHQAEGDLLRRGQLPDVG